MKKQRKAGKPQSKASAKAQESDEEVQEEEEEPEEAESEAESKVRCQLHQGWHKKLTMSSAPGSFWRQRCRRGRQQVRGRIQQLGRSRSVSSKAESQERKIIVTGEEEGLSTEKEGELLPHYKVHFG